MRRYTFIISIIGIFSLLLILNFQNPIQISSPNEINLLKNNQQILTTGIVAKETQNRYYKTFVLDNSLQLTCQNPCPSFLNKEITALAIYQEYNSQLMILKISSSQSP